MAKVRANRTRKNELKIYLSDNEKYILDRKVELSKRKSASDYIRTLILFGFVYDVDYSYLRQYNETLGKISGNLNQIAKRINSTGNVYEEDMAEVKAIMDEVWRMQKAMLKKQPLIHNGQPKLPVQDCVGSVALRGEKGRNNLFEHNVNAGEENSYIINCRK